MHLRNSVRQDSEYVNLIQIRHKKQL